MAMVNVSGCVGYSPRENRCLRELHYQSSLSKRLGYFDEKSFASFDSKLYETEKVLGALMRSFRNPNSLQPKPLNT